MNASRDVSYALDFSAGRGGRPQNPMPSSGAAAAGNCIPRIARLMALAIRFEELVRNKKVRDYAELARLGRVTRARMTQIMQLSHLAPDVQEQVLFLSNSKGLNERNLRPVVRQINWEEQRRLFHKITDRFDRAAESGMGRLPDAS